jgi:hypothetical protein
MTTIYDAVFGGDFRHGCQYAYKHRRCRCTECNAWNADRKRAWRAQRKAAGRPVPRGRDFGFCAGCGITWDQVTPGCLTCTRRANGRAVKALAA